MLVELVVRDLGVIAEARLGFDCGMAVLTGETGAGKTMLVEALHLVAGGKADVDRVRHGAEQAVVEALFVVGETEWVLRRVVPASGRSRSYLNGELCTSAALGDLAAQLVEIHGQHARQSLLQARRQREALDRFGGIDTAALEAARRRITKLRACLEDLGGDDRSRGREMELLAHQVAEIGSVAPRVGEQEALAAEEDLLAGALEHRAAGEAALALLGDDGAALDQLGAAAGSIAQRQPFETLAARLVSAHAELTDCSSELRSLCEGIEPDEDRLAAVADRRRALSELRRRYGDGADEILAFAERAAARLEELESLVQRREAVHAEIEAARDEVVALAAEVGRARRAAARSLGPELDSLLGDLALPGARVEVDVKDTEDLPGAGSRVELLFAASAGSPALPLSKAASGGELSRVMLALRLVLSGGPPTMVFDEVDAGVGGEAASAVGRALAELGDEHQVLVVTHLPQVAAHAEAQYVVTKCDTGGTGLTTVEVLEGRARVVEISRMLSGSPNSDTAQEHAAELLDAAAARSGRPRR